MIKNYFLIAWRNLSKRKLYASKIQLSWQFYMFSLLVVGLIAILTVGYKSLQAAWIDPAKSLKSE